MSERTLVAALVLGWIVVPSESPGQSPVQLAFANPQPHFVAAWAPTMERAAERSAVLARRVSVQLSNASVDSALKALTNQAGLRIMYSAAVLPKAKRVTMRASDVAVVTALTEILFRSGLDVVVDRDGTLALVPCRHAAVERQSADSGVITGIVTDRTTGTPIEGAVVVVEGGRAQAATGPDGRYRIAGTIAGMHTVRARYLGYAPQSLTVTVPDNDEVIADFRLVKSAQRLEELVTVTPGGVEAALKAVPTPVSVITESDIAQQRPRTIQELFRQAVPGAVSWDNAADPATAAFSVRGASTLFPGTVGQMKVFVDGIEASNQGISGIDPNAIERVEVIRGPQAAAVYGSDAAAGVIQVFTKRGDSTIARPKVEAQAAMGIVQTPYDGFDGVIRHNYSLSLRGGANNVSYGVGGGYSHTGDWLPNGEISEQSNPSVYGGMRFARGIISVDISGRHNVTNSPVVFNPEFMQTGFTFFSRPFFQPFQFTNQTAGVAVGLAPTHGWQNTLTLGIDRLRGELVQDRARLTSPDDTLLSVSDNTFTKNLVKFSSSISGPLARDLSGSLTAGVEHYDLLQTAFSGTADGVNGTVGGALSAYRVSTDNTGYYAQGQLGIRDALFLTAGIRLEDNTNFGDSLGTPTSPRAGFSYVRSWGATSLKFRGSWGRAIRPPDATNRLSVGPNVVPNLAIGPERQRGWDAGIDATLGNRASLSVTYYDQTADNLIQFVRIQNDPEPLDQFQNVGRVKNTGVEVEAGLTLGVLRAKANYAYTRSRVDQLSPTYTGDLHVDDQVQSTPKHTAGALLSMTPTVGTTLTAGVAYVGHFTQTDYLALARCVGGTGPCPATFVVSYPSFAKINATVWQTIRPQLTGFLSVDNLTNSHAVELVNVAPVMGRISTIGFRFTY